MNFKAHCVICLEDMVVLIVVVTNFVIMMIVTFVGKIHLLHHQGQSNGLSKIKNVLDQYSCHVIQNIYLYVIFANMNLKQHHIQYRTHMNVGVLTAEILNCVKMMHVKCVMIIHSHHQVKQNFGPRIINNYLEKFLNTRTLSIYSFAEYANM